MAVNIPGIPFRFTGSAMPNFAESFYKPPTLAAKLLEAQLKNKHDKIINQYLPRSEEARIGAIESNTSLDPFRKILMQAQANETTANIPLLEQNTLKQKILNQTLNKRELAEIDELGSRADYYRKGGGGQGVGSKAENEFQNNVALDNPNIPPEKLRDAVNAIREGKNYLPDGTPVRTSLTTMEALNRVIKAGTTSTLLTQGVKANQGEAELKALDNFYNKLGGAYQGSLDLPFIGEFSPEQIKDSLDPREEAQKRLGRSIAIQALNYEKAQLRNNIAGGMPGITAINELMAHSGQIIKQRAPRISATARKEADKIISEGIEQMRKARMKAGFSPSSLVNDPLGIR